MGASESGREGGGREISPDLLPAALLSEMAYMESSKALGWYGVPWSRRLPAWKEEALREDLADGLEIAPSRIEELRRAFWLDDLQEAVSREIERGGRDEAARERLARRLWVALYARGYKPRDLEESLERRGESASSREGAPGMSRRGVWRSREVHCALFAKVWDREAGFADERVWVAYRGTDLSAKPSGALGDYLDLYRNFPKAWRAHYRSSHEAFGEAMGRLPERMRPKEAIFVGHSLGGAMAQEALLQGGGQIERWGGRARAITFGSPGTGEMGAATACAAGLGALAFGLAGLGKWARDRLGLGGERGGLARESEGVSASIRRSFALACAIVARATKIGPLGRANALSQAAWNAGDAERFGEEFGGEGWVGFRSPEGVERASRPGVIEQIAHRRDLVPAIGEASGFDFYGTRRLVEPPVAASANPAADHAMSLYAASAMDLLVRAGRGGHPWMRALAGCRRMVDGMLEIQASLREQAARAGREAEFLREQLRSSRYGDEREAGSAARERAGELRAFPKLVRDLIAAERRARDLEQGPGHFDLEAANEGRAPAASPDLRREMAWIRRAMREDAIERKEAKDPRGRVADLASYRRRRGQGAEAGAGESPRAR